MDTSVTVGAGVIEEIVRRIRTVSKPDRIILFGSAAEDRMTADSDIDLLVLETPAVDLREESVRLRRVLGGLGYAIDVIVMSTERFEESKDVIGGLAYPANRHGRIIYEGS